MSDGFWSGIFGGLFGPAISRYLARWFGKYRYWKIFAAAMFFVCSVSFVAAWLKFGLQDALVLLSHMLSFPGVWIPAGMALVFVMCVFLGSRGRT
jgi:hypothetical protein